ncbi:endonuclease-reverse transcriptase [Elysia marginata]|uniref:Endonuclease-reverse transcriptase n=1 Tax=Elysia marginata TaxID=1093978 RepID=A0AAV4J3C3_9GAST|nr:endonuclease-reverse transcriptase [Elysia marginata]
MLRMAFNVSYKDHLTNIELYGDLAQVTSKIRQQRWRLFEHCIRHPEEIAYKLVLWNPLDGTRIRGQQKTTYGDNLPRDIGIENSLQH